MTKKQLTISSILMLAIGVISGLIIPLGATQ
jgi:hypothetical protein